jgi:hypothetical protein
MRKKFTFFSCLTILVTGMCLLGVFVLSGYWMVLRPQPADVTRTLFQGVVYQRDTRDTPRPIVVHVIRVNLGADGIDVLVTPGNPDEELPLAASTTSNFLKQHQLQVAINGDGFEPWYSRTILNYYPHNGDPVDVIGQAISGGVEYSQMTDAEPTLYFTGSRNQARINQAPGKPKQAVSGNAMLLQGGAVVATAGGVPQPRTAVGLDKRRRELILVVVDGRQPGYSEGVTLSELAGIMQELGAYEAINLDGGGSSTLVVQGPNGRPQVLNSPINFNLPGFQRPVGNHLGIFALTAGSD